MAEGAPAPVPPNRSEDLALVERLARRDESALQALIDAYGRFVYGKALRIARDTGLAEKIAQDALLVLWWQPERFDPSKGSLRSFLIGVARFKAIDAVRNEDPIPRQESLVAEMSAWVDEPIDSGDDNGSIMGEAVAKLPAPQREAIFLAYFGGLNYREMARSLGIPEGTAKTRIRDALHGLRSALPIAETGMNLEWPVRHPCSRRIPGTER